MATVNDQNQEDENQRGSSSSDGQEESSQPTSVASASPGSSQSSGSKQQSQTPAYNSSAPTSSGSFTNLKSYLNSNNSGKNFSNQVNQNLQQQGSTLNNNIQGASNQFNNQVQSTVNPVQQNYQAYQQVAANNDPNAIVNYANQGNNAQTLQGLESATYTGPKSLNDLTGNYNGAALQSQIGNYQNLANDTGSEAGRMNLLQSLYGNQKYNQGQQTLDNVFLQGNNFGNTVSQANKLNNDYNTASNNSTTSAQNAQNEINQAATGTINSLNAAVGNQNTNVQNEVQQAIANQQAQMNNFINNYGNGKISSADAAALGITSGANTFNLDPSQFITQGNSPTQQNVATTQDYNNFKTLQNILGTNANTQASGILSGFQDPSQAGQLGPAYSLNQEAYQNALASAKDAYKQAINPVQQQLDQLNIGYNNSPFTYQGTSGNGYQGMINDMGNYLKSSGWAANVPGAENMSNEDLVKLALPQAHAQDHTGLPNNPIYQKLLSYGSPYFGNDVRNIGQMANDQQLLGAYNSLGGIGSDPLALTQLYDDYTKLIGAKQSALQNLATQYGANKALDIE